MRCGGAAREGAVFAAELDEAWGGAADEPGLGSVCEGAFPGAGCVQGISALALGGEGGLGCGVVFRACILSCSLGWLGLVAARAGDAYPPVRGALAGELKIEALAELGLKWNLALAADGVMLRAERAGVVVEVAARPEAGGAWSWRVERGEVDLAEVWPLVRGLAGEAAAGWSASGRITLSGEGRWDAAAGPTGEVGVELREGWAGSDEAGVEVRGIELDTKTTDLLAGALPAGQVLRVAKVVVAGTEVRDARVVFGVTEAGVVEVAQVEAGVLGGRVKLKPFNVVLAAPKIVAAADVDALQLGEVAALMPWLLNAAQGRLRGRVELAWDEAKGLRLRDGGLDIVKSDDAVFRLAPSPGLLTGSMEDKFRFFPGSRWWRWIGINNPAYEPLKAIEQGREGLRLETFRVTFWPDGAGRGRPATIHIVGKPTSGKLVEEVAMDVNFYGPLTEAMGFGLNQEFTGFNFVIQ